MCYFRLVRATDVIRAPKSQIDTGKWQAGHIPPSAFPLSKAKRKNYRYGAAYRWRVISFQALECRCRVLVLYNEGKGIFRASLGIEINGDMRVLCMHEFHADEPGWHCHAHLVEAADVDVGVFRTGMNKWPGNARLPVNQQFAILDEDQAYKRALRFYNIEMSGSLL